MIQFEGESDIETKRINARRARDAERTKKLYSARLRNVGADIVGIQAQIQSKKEWKEQEKINDKNEMNQQEEIRRYVTEIEYKEAMRKQKEQEILRKEWLQQSIGRKDRKEADIAESVLEVAPVVPDQCALGALQKFDGEDPLRGERVKLQAAQLREWNAQQHMEKKQKEFMEKQEEMNVANRTSDVVSYQEAVELEQARERTRRNEMVQNENKRLAMEKKGRLEYEQQMRIQQEQHELASLRNSALLSEDPNQATSAISANRIRPDHFKGMQKEQVDAICKSNEQLKLEKQKRLEEEKQQDKHNAAQQEYFKRCMEEQEYNQVVRQREMNRATTETLQQQAIDAKERERKQRELSRGKIENGFFDGFGKSFR